MYFCLHTFGKRGCLLTNKALTSIHVSNRNKLNFYDVSLKIVCQTLISGFMMHGVMPSRVVTSN